MPRIAPVPSAPPATSVESAALATGDKVTALKLIREDLGECQRCQLGQTRTKLVYGQGNPHAEVLFLGEAPGEDEDLSGLAFVGKAGQLLTKMIEAMGFTREQVYICNINKCRPPGNRKPEPVEVEACRPFVERQIRAIRPKAIVALGATATHSLLRTDAPISRLRNVWTAWEGIPVMPTFHPSYLLRSPGEKGKAWEDLKLVLAKLGREVPKRGA
jgi:DNA polymerase